MNKVDLWSFITGIAGIGSLILALWDKFPNLKKILLPIGYILIGFTIGRVSYFGEKIFLQTLSDSQSSGILVVVFLLFLFASFCFQYFMRKNEAWYAYMSILMILIIIGPSLLENFSKASNRINSVDYLKLSGIYEQQKDFDTAIQYLGKYSDKVNDQGVREQVSKKISELRKSQAESFKSIYAH